MQKNTLTICTYYRVGVTPYVFFSFLFKIKQLNSKNNKIQIKQRVSETLLRCQHESWKLFSVYKKNYSFHGLYQASTISPRFWR